jgi:hypothetical protein
MSRYRRSVQIAVTLSATAVTRRRALAQSGEGADRVGAPLDLAVEPLEAVRRSDAVPVLLREDTATDWPTSRWLRPSVHFCLRISRVLRMDSRSVAIPPPVVGAGSVVAVQRRFVGAPGPGKGRHATSRIRPRGRCSRCRSRRSRCADPAVHVSDPRVHDDPILLFTMRRSWCSRSAGTRTLLLV